LIGPLNSDVGVNVVINADNVRDEPLLHDSFPPEVREALKTLDADARGEFPKFLGSFECRVNRAIGPHSLWIIDTDVTLDDASGKMVAFPYFLEHVTGKLAIREGFVDIIGATMKRKDASLTIEGRVTWRAGVGGRPLEPGEIEGHVTPARPDLKITARNVPVDKDLLAALPADRREWLTKAGLTGALDIDGRVWRPGPNADPAIAHSEAGSEMTHAFDIVLKNGTIWPTEGTFAVSNLLGHLRLLPDRLTINDMTGKRGVGDLSGRGEVSWPQNKPNIFFSGTATKLALDRTLYNILPAGAQTAWDAVKPEGVVDLDLSYRGAVGVMAPTQPTIGSTGDSPSPSGTSPVRNLDLIIHPVKLAATVQAVPYRLDDITGTVRLSSGKVQLTDLVGKHGDGTIRISGSGAADKTDWDLRLSAEKIKVDDAFRKALPGGLASVVEGLKLNGMIGFEFPKLTGPRRGSQPLSTSQIKSSTTTPSTPLDVDFNVKLAMNDASIDVGVPDDRHSREHGIGRHVRGSKLAALAGPLDLSSTVIAGRRAEDVHAEFFKPDEPGRPAHRQDHRPPRRRRHLGARRSRLPRRRRLALPHEPHAPQRRTCATSRASPIRTSPAKFPPASTWKGSWSRHQDPPRPRRRQVTGKEMYKIPLVLGLLQITNLSLPLTSPFTNAGTRYTVDGNAVTFESIELRGNDMLMSGSGNSTSTPRRST
jgi:hypothetical protein